MNHVIVCFVELSEILLRKALDVPLAKFDLLLVIPDLFFEEQHQVANENRAFWDGLLKALRHVFVLVAHLKSHSIKH